MDIFVAVTFGLSLVSSILSGISGGGAGFIMVPYYIFIGLTPQQAVATGKMGALGVSAGAITAFQGKGLVHKKYLYAFIAITTVCALFAAWFIPQIEGEVFQKIIGWTLIILTPTLFINKKSLQPGPRSRGWIIAGFIAYTIFSLGQTILGTGIGTLLLLVLMFLFGLSALEANATKRVSQAFQAVILFVLLLAQGFVVLLHGGAALLGAWIGGHIGSRIAIKQGSGFVKVILAGLMIASGIALLV